MKAAVLKFRLRVEQVLCGVSAALTLLTLVLPSWLEAIFGVDPDHGSGAAEWLIVIALALLAIASGVLARRDHTRLLALPHGT